MKALFLFIVMCVAHAGFSQLTEKDTAYFDINWNRVYGKEGAAYYRLAEKEGTLFRVKTYYISGPLQMEAVCSQHTPYLKFEGPAKFYYENGKLKKDVVFRDDKEVGIRKTFFENGVAEKTVDLDGPKMRYILFQNEEGKDLLKGGTTIISVPNNSADSVARLRTNFEDVRDYFLIGSFFTENAGKDTVYYTTETQATYPGGYQLVGQHISNTLIYPRSAKDNYIEGKTLVQFIVDASGSVRNARVYKGFDRECNAEALRAVSTLKPWNPSIHRGKPVHSIFLLPVVFKLVDDTPIEPTSTKKKKRKR